MYFRNTMYCMYSLSAPSCFSREEGEWGGGGDASDAIKITHSQTPLRLMMNKSRDKCEFDLGSDSVSECSNAECSYLSAE